MDFGLFFDSDGPFGLNEGFFQNLTSELLGLIFSAIVISLVIESYRAWREKSRWKASRLRIAEDVNQRHFASARDLQTSLETIVSGDRPHGTSLHKRTLDSLEAITRYYERNVYFLPPSSLRHFEAYRTYYKNFAQYLRRFSEASQGHRPMLSKFQEELENFDFAQLDKQITHFEASLGYKSQHASQQHAKKINALVEQLVKLPDDHLSRNLA